MLAVAVLGVVGIMSVMVQGAMKQPMGLLYSGLDASVTGEIIDELDKRGTRYEIKGDAILVPQNDRDSVRFALARDGLPKQSVQGYELLDNVNGFSVTSEMYNAAYWRAKEGELTRTILAVPGDPVGAGPYRGEPAVGLRALRSGADSFGHAVFCSRPDGQPGTGDPVPGGAGRLRSQPGRSGRDRPQQGHSGRAWRCQSAERAGVQSRNRGSAAGAERSCACWRRVSVAGNARVSVSVDVSHERQRTSAVTYDPDSRVVRYPDDRRCGGDQRRHLGRADGVQQPAAGELRRPGARATARSRIPRNLSPTRSMKHGPKQSACQGRSSGSPLPSSSMTRCLASTRLRRMLQRSMMKWSPISASW
jgi:flagellar M-ring protein FliF